MERIGKRMNRHLKRTKVGGGLQPGLRRIMLALEILAAGCATSACNTLMFSSTLAGSGPPTIEDYATIEGVCEGAPVYSFSNITYIYGVSPDLLPGAEMQAGNAHPIRKIKPKKSWEIKHNLVGISHEMTPKTAWNDRQPFFTEIGMAKYLTRNLVGHNGLGIEAAPCHAHYTGFGHAQSLVRPKLPAETVNPCRPTPAFYAWRTIATVMDDFYPAEFPVELTHNERIFSSTFAHGDKKTFLYAAWIDEETFDDERVQIKTDVTFPGMKARRAWGIDLFSGTEQELMIHQEENSCVLNEIWIKDYPTFIRLEI